MKFTPTWYQNDVADIPSFQELEDITGSAYDDQGVYIGPKEKPEMQLVMDQRTNRQYWAPKEYDEDAITYGAAKLDKDFNSKEWWGMVHDPHLTTGEKVSTAYIEALKQAGKLVVNAPTKIVAAATGLTDAVGIDAGNLAKAAFINNPSNLPIYLASNVARKGIKATAQDYLDLLKSIKTPAGQMGETAALYRASAQNWQSTVDKYLPDVDENIRAHSTLVAIGSMAGQIGGSLLLAAATNGVGGLPAVATVFGGQQFYDIREEYLQKGYSLDSANIYAFMAAVAEGGLEAVGFGKLVKYGTISKSFRNTLIGGLVEASQEMSQTTAEELITNLSGVREETLAEILTQIAVSGLAGFVPGMGFSIMSGGANIQQEKSAYELTRAVKQQQAQQEATPVKEGQVIKGPTPKQELELAKANKGSNPVYEVVKNIANAHGVTDEKAIDAFFYFAKNQAVQGKVGEELLQGLGKQIVAYKSQLALTDKTADKENKQAAQDISFHLSEEAAQKYHDGNVKAMEESGIEKTKAEVAATMLDRIYNNLSEKLGFDLQQFKQVVVRALPKQQQEETIKDYDGEVPFQDSKEGEIKAIQKQINELDKLSRSKPRTNLLSTLRKTGVDYKNTNLDPQKLKDLRIKNVPVSKGGLGAEAVDYLTRHGFMQDFAQGEQVSYEMTAEKNDQANEMLERAISGEAVYRMDDMEKMQQAEQAQGYKDQLQAQLDELATQEGKRGYIKIGDLINEIVLGKNSDVSTLQHEMVHHFKNVIYLAAAQGNKNAIALQQQIEAIIEAHKDEVKQEINTEEEVLSEAFEAWLYGGVVAENEAQQKLFDAMKQFFQDVYDSVRAITGIRIDPEIDMFFRQLTGEMPIQMREEATSPSGKYDYKVTKGEKYGFTQEQREHIAKEVIDNMEGSLFSRFKVKDVKGEQPLGGYWKSRQTWWTDQQGKKTKEPEKADAKYQSNAQEVIKINIPDSKSVLTVHKDPLAIRAMFKDLGISITPKPEYANDIYYQFGGQKAKTADPLKLNKAEEMEASGTDNETIRQETGWFRGADRKWRFEISDQDASVSKAVSDFKKGAIYDTNTFNKEIDKFNEKLQKLSEEKKHEEYQKVMDQKLRYIDEHKKPKEHVFKLGDFLKHDSLYKAYPELKDLRLEIVPLGENTAGAYSRGQNKIQLSASMVVSYSEDNTKKTLLHEIAHYIQHREGFAKGGDPSKFRDKRLPPRMKKLAFGRAMDSAILYNALLKADTKGLEPNLQWPTASYIERFMPELEKIAASDDKIKRTLERWQDANKQLKEYDNNTAIMKYKRLGGEIEARNVEKRANFTELETAMISPESSQDIKNADAIIQFDDGTQLAYNTQEESRYFQDREQAYRDDRAQRTGAKAADPKPSKERIASDLAVIKQRGVTKYEPKSRVVGSLGDFAKHILLSVRQRAGAVDNKLKAFFDKLDYFQPNLEKKFASKANGFIKKFQGLTEDEKNEFDYYIYNQCHEELNAFLKEKGMEKEYNEVRQLLNFIYSISNQAGIDMNFVHEYFPTSMIDYAGFLDYLKGTDKWSYIQKALREADPEGLWSDKEKAEAINKLLRGYRLDPVSKPKNAKERTILYKSPELMKFYEHSDVALIKYLQGMSQALAINKAFGKGTGFNTDETIGAIVLDLINSGSITNKEEAEVKKLLKSRLSYGATPEFIAMVKNVGYLQTMNNITSAVTQLGDLYAPFYKYSFGTAIKAIFGKSEITKTDLGLDKIWEEFSDSSKTGIAVDKLFKAIGLEAMDSFGKNVAINASWLNLKEQAAKGDIALTERLAYTFGKDAGKVLADIKAGNVTDDVKILIWSDLADTQPIGRSGVPTGYLDNPHGRLFYQLKTFSLNQISLFYADSLVNIRKGIKYKNKAQFLKGVQNGFKLLLLLTAGNAAADVLKNLIMGRDIDISDTVVSNLLWNIGVSKYTFYKGKRDGYARAILSSYLQPPQISIGDDIYMDVRKIATGKRELKDTQMVTYLPFGRAYYWWFGGGRTSEIEKAKKEKKAKRNKRKKK